MKKLFTTLLLLVLALASVFSAGHALAYWLVEGKTDNLISTGKLAAKIVEEYEQGQLVFPGDVVDKVVNIANTGEVDSIIRVRVAKAWGRIDDEGGFSADETLSTANIVIDYNSDLWVYDDGDGYFYYKRVLVPGEMTAQPLFTKFAVSSAIANDFAGMHVSIGIEMESLQAGYGAISLWGKTLADLDISYSPIENAPSEEPVIAFISPEKKFSFVSKNTDLFCAWEGLIPGESRSQSFSVQNLYAEQVPISFRGEYSYTVESPEDQALVDALLKKYVTISITEESGKEIYRGFIWGNLEEDTGPTMKEFIPLGEFAPRETKRYNVTISISPEVDRNYNDLKGQTTWVFRALRGTDSKYPPKTGEGLGLSVYLITLILSSVTLVCLILRKKNSA